MFFKRIKDCLGLKQEIDSLKTEKTILFVGKIQDEMLNLVISYREFITESSLCLNVFWLFRVVLNLFSQGA